MRKQGPTQIKILFTEQQRQMIHLAAAIQDVAMAEFCRAAAIASATTALKGFKMPLLPKAASGHVIHN